MIISNCRSSDIVDAVKRVNVEHETSNVKIRDMKWLNAAHTRWQVTFTVNNSRDKFSRVSSSAFHPERRVSALCWHGHKLLFEALLEINPEAVIRTMHTNTTYSNDQREWAAPVIGPPIYPVRYSECCDCDNTD